MTKGSMILKPLALSSSRERNTNGLQKSSLKHNTMPKLTYNKQIISFNYKKILFFTQDMGKGHKGLTPHILGKGRGKRCSPTPLHTLGGNRLKYHLLQFDKIDEMFEFPYPFTQILYSSLFSFLTSEQNNKCAMEFKAALEITHMFVNWGWFKSIMLIHSMKYHE